MHLDSDVTFYLPVKVFLVSLPCMVVTSLVFPLFPLGGNGYPTVVLKKMNFPIGLRMF